jgi:hypothetical protein
MTPFGGVCGITGFGLASAFAFASNTATHGVSAFAFEPTVFPGTLPTAPLLLEAPPESGTSTSISSGFIWLINSIIVLAFAFAGSADWLRAPSSFTVGRLGPRDMFRL